MAVYAIGDIQGCYEELRQLLDLLHFDPVHDRVLFTGDLVNRGPDSLSVLRFVRSLGERAVTVLGNHDLHLLAIAAGVRHTKKNDTLAAILAAPDRDELLDWLRRRPLAHRDAETGWLLIHAGLVPQWSGEQALVLAREVERVLASSEAGEFYRNMYGDQPCRWEDDLAGWPRLRFITNVLTRTRYCRPDGTLDFTENGAPSDTLPPLLPWFRVAGRRSADDRVVFGHWSTLGYLRENGVLALDGGCLWGGLLVAARLDQVQPAPVTLACGAKQPIGTP
ncbi:MAG: symmetrical bis(5'-nucleosyl)-tetraphosphatase [Anaerolineales bacterium]